MALRSLSGECVRLTVFCILFCSLLWACVLLAPATIADSARSDMAHNEVNRKELIAATDSMDEGEAETPDKLFEPTSAPSENAGQPGSSTDSANAAIPITGGGQELKDMDQIMLNLMQSYNIPGGALAIAKDGHLVFARGYGFANKHENVPFSPTSLFCLASVTKAVSGAAALKLVDEGKLNLDDTLYNVLGKPKMGKVVDKRVFDITVRQLLHHSAGWKTDFVGYDQDTYNSMTADGPVSFNELFSWVMANKKLDYAPGAECHYSNYQFGAVKSVIESASGQTFETYVKQHVMVPMGIVDSELEPEKGSYLAGEAHRYGPKARQIAGGHGNEKLTGPLGSWEASSIDMVKFLTAIDGTRTKPFLSAKSFAAMIAPVPPPVPVRQNGSTFGLGWDTAQRTDGGVHFAKNGGVAGVHTFIEHLPDNIDLVFFFNGTGIDQKPKIMGAATQEIHKAVANVRNWPQIDLFSQYN